MNAREFCSYRKKLFGKQQLFLLGRFQNSTVLYIHSSLLKENN